jgi:hypothetical protein
VQFLKDILKVDNDDSAIFALPGKKGRKLAVDRVKTLDKDTAELERKCQAVEVLLSVYNQKVTDGFIHTI